MTNRSLGLYIRERSVFQAIVQETLQKDTLCAYLSLSHLSEMTGVPRTTVRIELNRLRRRRLITIDRSKKTHLICMNIEYREIY